MRTPLELKEVQPILGRIERDLALLAQKLDLHSENDDRNFEKLDRWLVSIDAKLDSFAMQVARSSAIQELARETAKTTVEEAQSHAARKSKIWSTVISSIVVGAGAVVEHFLLK